VAVVQGIVEPDLRLFVFSTVLNMADN